MAGLPVLNKYTQPVVKYYMGNPRSVNTTQKRLLSLVAERRDLVKAYRIDVNRPSARKLDRVQKR